MAYNPVLEFWFKELEPKQWWAKDAALDARIRERFSVLHGQAAKGELISWRATPEGRLAEIIILDQFSRNIFRDTPKAFAFDPMALTLAQEGVRLEVAKKLPMRERAFFYLPYMHSESRLIHEEAERLFQTSGLEENLKFELAHKRIIDRFGRYPHRNAILGRQSTPEESEFLKKPGSAF